MTEIKGWHVFAGFAAAFTIIIGVNLTLAFNAVRTFPGLEVKNSYIASQSFDADRAAQTALGWDVSAYVQDGTLVLSILDANGAPVTPQITRATFGRATTVADDQAPDFRFDGKAHVAKIDAGQGNWNLRLEARTEDGTIFRQRIVVETRP